MNKIQIINGSMEEKFYELLNSTEKNLYLSSPYIKYSVANSIIEKIKSKIDKGLDCKFIHSFKIQNFINKASDIEALRLFNSTGIKQKNVINLHAKFYIFDNKAIVTSGNLTKNGLFFNLEYGLFLEGPVVERIKTDFLDIFNNHIYNLITNEDFDFVEKTITEISNENPNINSEVDLLYNSEKIILKNLYGWKREVFKVLTEIKKETFNLEEVYNFKTVFHKTYPENKNIEAKIRQQLQFLRDLGLLVFLDNNGIYKKMWR